MQIFLADPQWHNLPIDELFPILVSYIFSVLQMKIEGFL